MRNPLQTLIASRALSIAKTSRHNVVDVAHVFVALADTVLEGDARGARSRELRAKLPPRGHAIKVEGFSPAADDVIAKCKSEKVGREVLAQEPPDSPTASIEPRADEVSPTDEPPESGSPNSGPSRKSESTAAILAELDALVGLAKVKQQVRKVIAVAEANRFRASKGARGIPQSLHLVFTGNPGTGKTTVARIVARLYRAAGAIENAGFREATRSDLIAPYVGQTSIKTDRLLQSVRPGVLFVDEAYSLTQSYAEDFAGEAIASLVKGMEDHRGDLAVIVAGYQAEMEKFVDSNPGLRSRFQTKIQFDDYRPAELVHIYRSLARDADIRLGEGVERRVESAIRAASGRRGFGNARFVRSLWEESYANMAVRAAADGELVDGELDEIAETDVPDPLGGAAGARGSIGFAK